MFLLTLLITACFPLISGQSSTTSDASKTTASTVTLSEATQPSAQQTQGNETRVGYKLVRSPKMRNLEGKTKADAQNIVIK